MCRGGCHSCRARWGSRLGPAVLSAPPGLRLTFSGPSQGTPERATPPRPKPASFPGIRPNSLAMCSILPKPSCILCSDKESSVPRRAGHPARHRLQPPTLPCGCPQPWPCAPGHTRCQPCVPPSLRLTLPASASLLGLDIHS